MTVFLRQTINDNELHLTERLFNSLIYVFTESQQWSTVNEMLNRAAPENCTPDKKTVNYLRTNLIYCFDPTLRGNLKANMKSFEEKFFSSRNEVNR